MKEYIESCNEFELLRNFLIENLSNLEFFDIES